MVSQNRVALQWSVKTALQIEQKLILAHDRCSSKPRLASVELSSLSSVAAATGPLQSFHLELARAFELPSCQGPKWAWFLVGVKGSSR
jgi:hypothetical protein